MHELSIIHHIFEIVEEIAEENHLLTVTKVTLNIGRLQQIVPDMLTFAFETVAKGTRAEGAQLEVKEVPIKMKCRACHTEFTIEEHAYICPQCSGTSLDTLQGMEVVLESVEGEQA
jgi:hydrogenase nickel incorporation protein HypA/HybF